MGSEITISRDMHAALWAVVHQARHLIAGDIEWPVALENVRSALEMLRELEAAAEQG